MTLLPLYVDLYLCVGLALLACAVSVVRPGDFAAFRYSTAVVAAALALTAVVFVIVWPAYVARVLRRPPEAPRK